MSFAHVIPSADFWRRTAAMLIKEFIQLRRDRVSFAMIIMIPVMQLLLFGYAINTTPRHMPTVVLLQEQSDVGRSILKAIENTAYFRVVRQAHDAAEFDQLLKSGTVLFGVEVPAEFERALRRGDRPALLFAADATDPVAAGTATACSARSCRRPSSTITPFPTRRQAHSRSARTPATIRQPRPRSTSSRAWSERS